MALSVEQLNEMNQEMRELRRTGKPEIAETIKLARTEERYYLGDEATPAFADLPKRPPTAGPGSNVKAWRNYAIAVSDFDLEIIESTKAKDLMKMLKAHDL